MTLILFFLFAACGGFSAPSATVSAPPVASGATPAVEVPPLKSQATAAEATLMRNRWSEMLTQLQSAAEQVKKLEVVEAAEKSRLAFDGYEPSAVRSDLSMSDPKKGSVMFGLFDPDMVHPGALFVSRGGDFLINRDVEPTLLGAAFLCGYFDDRVAKDMRLSGKGARLNGVELSRHTGNIVRLAIDVVTGRKYGEYIARLAETVPYMSGSITEMAFGEELYTITGATDSVIRNLLAEQAITDLHAAQITRYEPDSGAIEMGFNRLYSQRNLYSRHHR